MLRQIVLNMVLKEKYELEGCPVGTIVILYFLNGQSYIGRFQGIDDDEGEITLQAIEGDNLLGLPLNYLTHFMQDQSA